MSQQAYKPLTKLEDEPLWVEAGEIAEYMYSVLVDFPEDEKWNSESKLRTEANNLIYYVSQAIGNASPSNNEYDWGYARRSIVALKTMYRFATRQKFIELEPSVMVRLDDMMKLIDNEVAAAYSRTEAQNKKELDLWQAKYDLASENRL